MNVATRIEDVATANASRTAFLLADEALSFAAFDDRSSRIAGGLRELGVGVGDRVAVMAGSHPEFVASMVGAWKVGVVFVALNAQLGSDEVRHQLANATPTLALCDPGRSEEVLAEAAADVGSVRRILRIAEVVGPPVSAVELPDTSDATIFYTSGTTGVPKGATHTHRSIAVQIDQVCQRYAITEDDLFLSTLPIYLLSIATCGPLSSLLTGATCRIMSRYDPVAFARAIREDGTTVIASSVMSRKFGASWLLGFWGGGVAGCAHDEAHLPDGTAGAQGGAGGGHRRG